MCVGIVVYICLTQHSSASTEQFWVPKILSLLYVYPQLLC